MRFANLRTAVALGAALSLGIGVGAAYAGNGDLVIEAYADGSVVDVLVEAVVDPDSEEYQEVEASGIANHIYLIFDSSLTLDNGTGEPNHVLDIPTGNPGGGSTYNPYWEFYAVIVTDTSVLPLTSVDAVLAAEEAGSVTVIGPVTYALAAEVGVDLGYYTDDYALVLCPEISAP